MKEKLIFNLLVLLALYMASHVFKPFLAVTKLIAPDRPGAGYVFSVYRVFLYSGHSAREHP